MAELRDWLSARLRHNLSVDLRALALMRIAFAVLIAIDLVNRSDDIAAHYSDEGWLPRRDAGSPVVLRLFFLDGDPAWVRTLFVVGGVLAFFLLIGCMSRLAALGCFLVIGSLQARNYLVNQGGDDLLRNMLLFMTLAPIGARWSLDAFIARRWARRGPQRVLEPPTIALHGQLFLVYLSAGMLKAHQAHWWRGEAVYHALSADHLTTSFGQWLYPHWYVLKAANYGTLALELVGPLLLVLGPPRVWFRLALIGAYVSLHLGIAVTIHIGLFSAVSIACWLFTLPSTTVDRLARLFGDKPRPPEESAPFTWGPSWLRKVFSAAGALAFAYLVVSTIVAEVVPEGRARQAILAPGENLWLKRRWDLFVTPRSYNGWLIIHLRTLDRRDVDLLRDGAELSYERPELFYGAFANQRWRKMLTQLRSHKRKSQTRLYLKWLCLRHDEARSITLIYMKRAIGQRYDDGPTERETMGTYDCIRARWDQRGAT